MQVGLLGPLVVWHETAERPVARTSARTVLAALALSPGTPVSADVLGDAVWAGDSPATWRNVLQVQVGHLRRACPWLQIDTHPGGYVLQVPPDDVDAYRFELLVRSSMGLLPAADPVEPSSAGAEPDSVSQANDLLHEALGLWRGTALADFTFAPFAQSHIARLDSLRLTALEHRLATDLVLGRHSAVVDELSALTAEHPLREVFWAQLAVALYRSGRQAEALAALTRARHILLEELGLDPGPQLRRLEEQVLRQDPALDVSQQPPSDRLPRVPGKLIGRDADHEHLVDELRRDEAPLVTIVGPGGVGKTRLAVEVARTLASDLPVRFVPLANVVDPAHVATAIARAVGISVGTESPIPALQRASSGGAAALWVLDNCEHVLDAVAEVVAAVAGVGNRVVVLATSREPIGVRLERTYLLGPLVLPQPDAAAQHVAAAPAVQLLIERTAANGPPLVVSDANARDIANMVSRLDGLPLAIELAAPALAASTPVEVMDRFGPDLALPVQPRRDAEERHRTLSDALEWSWDLLDARQRHLLPQLSVFAGGFDLAAVEAVCGHGDGETHTTLMSLVDKNLVSVVERGSPTPQRFQLLRIVRDYAAQRLAAADRDALVEAHRRYYRQAILGPLPEAARTPRISPEVMAAFRRDYDNLRAALEATWKARRLLDFAEFCRLLWVPSVLAGRAREAVEDLQHAVDAESSPTARSGSRGSSYPSSVRVDLRLALAVCQLEIGKVESAYALCIQAIDLAERQPDNSLKLAAYADAVLCAHLLRAAPPEVPDLLNRADELAAQERDLAILASYHCAKGLQCYGSNELESAERMLLLFLQEAYALNDSFATLVALANLGELANAEGRYPVAAAWSERAVHVSATLGSEWVGSAQANLATAWLGVGDVTRAEAMFAAQIQRFWINGDLRAVAELLQRLAACAAARGDQERALTLYGAYRIALDTHGWAVLPAEHRLTNQFLSSSLVGPHADVAITIGYAMSLADAVAFATAS